MSNRIGSFASDKSDGEDTNDQTHASIEQALFRLWGTNATNPRFSTLIASDNFSDVLEGMGREIFPELDKLRRMVGAMVLLLGWAPQEKMGKITFIPGQKSFKDLPMDQNYVQAFEVGFSLGLDPNEVLAQPKLQWSQSWREWFIAKVADYKTGTQQHTETQVLTHSDLPENAAVSNSDSIEPVDNTSSSADSIESRAQQVIDTLQQIDETERDSFLEQRVGQSLLRNLLLEAYRGRCAMCDVDAPEVLRASHVIPWATRDSTRLDPTNVILLCGLHDLAFENNFITIGPGYRIEILATPPGLKAVLEAITHDRLALPISPQYYPNLEFVLQRRS